MTEKGGKERACEESVRPVLDDKELEDFVENDRIGMIMKRISTQGSLQGRKTNHSARKNYDNKIGPL